MRGRLSMTMTLFPPDKRRRDLDNAFKAPLDALAHAGVYEDDSQIDVLTIRRGAVMGDMASCHVQIEEITDGR